MSFTKNGDLKFFYSGLNKADISLKPGTPDLLRDPGLETAVLISLFSDQRAGDDDEIPAKDGNKRGYWGDNLQGFNIGSKLWLLGRTKITNETVTLAEQYNSDALQWLIDDGIADEIEVGVQRAGLYQLDTIIKIIKNDNSNIYFKYYLNWQAQIYGGF